MKTNAVKRLLFFVIPAYISGNFGQRKNKE